MLLPRTNQADGAQDFFDFFPSYNQMEQSEKKSTFVEIKKEPSDVPEELHQNLLLDHDYHLKVEPEDDNLNAGVVLRTVESDDRSSTNQIDSGLGNENLCVLNPSGEKQSIDAEKPNNETALSILEDIISQNTVTTDLDQFQAAQALSYEPFSGSNVPQVGMVTFCVSF